MKCQNYVDGVLKKKNEKTFFSILILVYWSSFPVDIKAALIQPLLCPMIYGCICASLGLKELNTI